jgi:hypothetical protein
LGESVITNAKIKIKIIIMITNLTRLVVVDAMVVVADNVPTVSTLFPFLVFVDLEVVDWVEIVEVVDWVVEVVDWVEVVGVVDWAEVVEVVDWDRS